MERVAQRGDVWWASLGRPRGSEPGYRRPVVVIQSDDFNRSAIATVIVEAGERSGALITADFALEQGREVMVVPGNINSPMSLGSNELLKQGAAPVTSAQDILDALGPREGEADGAVLARHVPELGPQETTVWQALGGEPRHVDDLARALGGRPGVIRGVAATYNRFQYLDARKAATEALGRFVARLVRPGGAGNVVPLRA